MKKRRAKLRFGSPFSFGNTKFTFKWQSRAYRSSTKDSLSVPNRKETKTHYGLKKIKNLSYQIEVEMV